MVTLSLLAIAIGTGMAISGTHLIMAVVGGTLLSVGSLIVVGELYRVWAKLVWGAPFDVGDVVRIVKGDCAGLKGTVVDVDQDLTPTVEFVSAERIARKRLGWRFMRRIKQPEQLA